MPLQVAYPQYEVGNRRRARVHLDAQKLLRVYGQPRIFQNTLTLAEPVQRVEHLALQTLQMLQRHVEEVAAPARGVEHAHSAQTPVKRLHLLRRVRRPPVGVELSRRGTKTSAHSCRSGSTTAGITSRSTYARGV